MPFLIAPAIHKRSVLFHFLGTILSYILIYHPIYRKSGKANPLANAKNVAFPNYQLAGKILFGTAYNYLFVQ
jgi:hypothetical protein